MRSKRYCIPVEFEFIGSVWMYKKVDGGIEEQRGYLYYKEPVLESDRYEAADAIFIPDPVVIDDECDHCPIDISRCRCSIRQFVVCNDRLWMMDRDIDRAQELFRLYEKSRRKHAL